MDADSANHQQRMGSSSQRGSHRDKRNAHRQWRRAHTERSSSWRQYLVRSIHGGFHDAPAIGNGVELRRSPSNHSAVQWWQVDPLISTGARTAPIQRGLIEDTAAVNCFNGNLTTPGQIVPCSEAGSFYAYPSIAVNAAKDVLIGFSVFSADDWAAAAYAYHSHTDPLNATRKPMIMQIGRAPYSYVAFDGKTRWGDYSATLTDPANDRDFWVVQEHADLPGTTGRLVEGLWGTRWAKVEPPVTKRRSAGRAH
jgi:hypothetical protein